MASLQAMPRSPVSCISHTQMTEDRTPLICLLTDNETHNAFCLKYWSVDRTGKWSEAFDALLSDSGLSKWEMTNMLKSACRAYLPHLRCGSCGTPLQVSTRSEYSPLTGLHLKLRKRSHQPLCASCDAAALAANREADLFAQQQHRDRVTSALKRLHENAAPVDYAKLGYAQSCLLYAALVAANVGPDDCVIPPLASQVGALAPTPKLSEDIYARLFG